MNPGEPTTETAAAPPSTHPSQGGEATGCRRPLGSSQPVVAGAPLQQGATLLAPLRIRLRDRKRLELEKMIFFQDVENLQKRFTRRGWEPSQGWRIRRADSPSSV